MRKAKELEVLQGASSVDKVKILQWVQKGKKCEVVDFMDDNDLNDFFLELISSYTTAFYLIDCQMLLTEDPEDWQNEEYLGLLILACTAVAGALFSSFHRHQNHW